MLCTRNAHGSSWGRLWRLIEAELYSLSRSLVVVAITRSSNGDGPVAAVVGGVAVQARGAVGNSWHSRGSRLAPIHVRG